MESEPVNKKLLFCFIILLSVMALNFHLETEKENEVIRLEAIKDQQIEIALGSTPVLAKAVSVYNITRGKKLYGKNDEVAMPLASIAKIMTVAVALNTHGPNEVVTLSPEAIKQAGNFGLFVGEKWKIKDLAKLTLISSANDGAFALSEKSILESTDFLLKMNAKAKRIGANQTDFKNMTGLDIIENDKSVSSAVFASALDANVMAAYGLLTSPDVFAVTTLPEINISSIDGVVHNFKNTNTTVSQIPNILLSKTGYTVVAGGNLVVIFENRLGEKIAITVLGSTFEGRFEDVEKLVSVLYTL